MIANNLAAASYADVRGKPTLPCPLEQRLQTPDLGLVPFRLGRLHLPQEGQEALM